MLKIRLQDIHNEGQNTIVTLHEEQLFNMNSRIAGWCFLVETGAAATLRKCRILFIFPCFQEEKTPSAFFCKSLPSERGPHDLAVMTEAPLPLSQSVS